MHPGAKSIVDIQQGHILIELNQLSSEAEHAPLSTHTEHWGGYIMHANNTKHWSEHVVKMALRLSTPNTHMHIDKQNL